FDIERARGLSDVLVGEVPPEGAIVASGVDKLSVLPCGTRVTNPADLIGSKAFRTLIEQLATRYECIVVDTPPVLAVADPMLVSEMADGVLLVAEANRTSRFALQRVVENLRRGGAPLLGIVLNLMPTGGIYGRYGGYYYRHYVDGDHGDADGARRGGSKLFG
ncbi:MAG: CpsD/CapB family tyrosine-protein kinase, partial [Gemmatimonadales bacterium]|nr:CpsD/CapB family tyrosine-protein kinase [Gemmatimonadales bacterium]